MGKLKSNNKIRSSPPRIEELESRILYSADFAPEVLPTLGSTPVVAEHCVLETAAADVLDDSAEYETIIVDPSELQAEERRVHQRNAIYQPESTTATAPNLQTRELVIVDTATPDYQQLIDDILAQNPDTNWIEVALLDASRDGIEQLTDILSTYSGLNGVH